MLVLGWGAAYAGDAKPRRPSPVTLSGPVISAATIDTILATPGTITFNAVDPDTGAATGSSPASVTWTIGGGVNTSNWTLTLQAGSTSFSGCGTVPASAVTVTCSTASISGGGGSGSCSGSFPLSTTPTQVAAGLQGTGAQSYSVDITFTLADSWRYLATSSPTCGLTLTYTVDAP
jgi:hypothetical protein